MITIGTTILIWGFIIALSVIFNVEYNPVYKSLLEALKLAERKPFNCSLCSSFWTGLIVGIISTNITLIIFLPLVSAMLSIVLSRLIDLIPVTIK